MTNVCRSFAGEDISESHIYARLQSTLRLVCILICGIDEAGRGCVIGPLVVAGVLVDENTQSKLKELGVKDSKLVAPKQRRRLAKEIKQLATAIEIIKISPQEIDKAVYSHRRLHKLNRLEAKTMAKILRSLKPDIAIVDAADVSPERFKQHIKERLPTSIQVVSEHKADMRYPVVSAASIVAKVERDRIIERLKVQHGDFGSGYMSDPKTKIFLKELAKQSENFPEFIRCSWRPAKTAKVDAKTEQTFLFESN